MADGWLGVWVRTRKLPRGQPIKGDMGKASGADNIFGPPFLYDPSAFGISFLWRWQGTIFPLVASSPLFWFLLAGHAAALFSYHTLDGEEPVLEWQAAIVPSSLLTFLLVTFGNQCCMAIPRISSHWQPRARL